MTVIKIYFATRNDYKVAEVRSVMKEYGIIVEKLDMEKDEDKELPIEQVAVLNAEKFARKFKLPVVVEDTGFFFSAYPNFPGTNPKLMFRLLGYKGLLKLLEGEKDRGAEFRSAVAYSDGKETKLFVGRLAGRVTEKPEALEIDVMPYERTFIAEGHDKAIAFLPRSEKNKMSHRAKAFRELAEWLSPKEEQKEPDPAQNASQDAGPNADPGSKPNASPDTSPVVSPDKPADAKDPEEMQWEGNGDVY
jgi:XTP/dITP diphosphohydrolase